MVGLRVTGKLGQKLDNKLCVTARFLVAFFSLLWRFSVLSLPFTRALLRRVLWGEVERRLDFFVGRAGSRRVFVKCSLWLLVSSESVVSYQYTAKYHDIAIVRACLDHLDCFLGLRLAKLTTLFPRFGDCIGIGGRQWSIGSHTCARIWPCFCVM